MNLTQDYPAIDHWTETDGPIGTNPSETRVDPEGVTWYVKFPYDDDAAINEHLAAQLYRAAKVRVPETKLVRAHGELGVAYRLIHDARTLGEAYPEFPKNTPTAIVAEVTRGFAVDALLANWDVAGLSHDNIIVTPGNAAYRIDLGGALLFRAQGGHKGNKLTPFADEWHSLRDPGVNRSTALLFRGITREELLASAELVLTLLTESVIDDLVTNSGLDDLLAHKLAETLMYRRGTILVAAEDLRKGAPDLPGVRYHAERADDAIDDLIYDYSSAYSPEEQFEAVERAKVRIGNAVYFAHRSGPGR